jgi:hypothetical protein
VKLMTERNLPAVEKAIREAFENSDLYTHSCQTDFEHGQWWVTCPACGAQWSVVDSVPGPFSFEEVTPAEEGAHDEPAI